MTKQQKLKRLEEEAESLRREIRYENIDKQNAALKTAIKSLEKRLSDIKSTPEWMYKEEVERSKQLEQAIEHQNKTIEHLQDELKKAKDEIDKKTAEYYRNCFEYHETIQELKKAH